MVDNIKKSGMGVTSMEDTGGSKIMKRIETKHERQRRK
jgi:hypothetical protein